MRRKFSAIVLIGLLVQALAVPASADTREQASKSSSTTKRVVWTLVGAGAGFAAGAFIGLNKFDDAINSDRKVWTSAIVGAAGGGVAGALLGRRSKSAAPAARAVRPAERIDVTWSEAIGAVPLPAPPRPR